jgi:hypothetical protein
VSDEYRALMALLRPTEQKAGDMWLCRRLGIVSILNAHRRGQAKRCRLMYFSLYHWGEPSLYSRACDWRDNDNNGRAFDPDGPREEKWEFFGNIFVMLPYCALAGRPYQRQSPA